jgi:CheY-like chemotaxis protein
MKETSIVGQAAGRRQLLEILVLEILPPSEAPALRLLPLALRLLPRAARGEAPTSIPMRLRPLVLVVDDDEETRAVYSTVLADEGMVVAEAGDGEDAFQKAVDSLPDLIVTDVSMPIMGGWELLRRLRADARTGRIPVIVCSGGDRLSGPVEFQPDSYLGKPCDPEELRREVRRLLRRPGALSP